MNKKISLLIGLMTIGCQQPTSPPIPPSVPIPPAVLPADLSQMLEAHNVERSKSGVRQLTADTRLIAAAQKHAEWMHNNRRMSHSGSNGSSFANRIRAEGYIIRTGGENIANGYADIQSVMKGWMNSSGHRANILNPNFNQIGFGRSGNYWCVVFATPLAGTIEQLVVIDEQPDGITGQIVD